MHRILLTVAKQPVAGKVKTRLGDLFTPEKTAEFYHYLILDTFRDYLARGYERVVIIDSDSPTLPASYLERAFDLLESNDVVFEPCEDGGYYLVGAKAAHPALFEDIEMSTATVLQDTMHRADAAKLRTALLPHWFDVGYPEDVRRLQDEISRDGEIAVHLARFFRERF